LRRLCTAPSLGRGFFDPEATLHALADEILKYRRALRLLARAIGWAEAGAPFGCSTLWRSRRTIEDADAVPPAA
jgi:hypothetical protein